MMQRPPDHPIIGKTITGVIARPGSDGREIVMLQFDDGTCFEVLSARSRRTLSSLAGGRRAARAAMEPPAGHGCIDALAQDVSQLSFFPHDGDLRAA